MRLNWFLSYRAGKPKSVRRTLALLGPTWLASPGRRIIQLVCLTLFLGLFLYTCWPYTARPARVWNHWLPVDVDAATGKATIAADQPPAALPAAGMVLYVVDTSTHGNNSLGSFRVKAVAGGPSDRQLALEPAAALSPEQLDRLAASFGPWSLRETPPGSWPSHYADDLQAKERLPAETFLMLDPLVSISAALAGRTWVGSLAGAAGILLVCLLVPRGFCGYVCPLGTLLDLFDGSIGRRVRRTRPAERGWWVHLKYYVLAATLAAALFGVLLSGFVAAIAVLTRGMAYLVTPLETAWQRGWHQVPPVGAGQWVSIGLLLAVFGLGLLRPRFWCKYACPTGAIFSIGNLLRISGRRVESTCIGCGKCVGVCPFDAIRPDFSTRETDCTFCQTCAGACPVGAIEFKTRGSRVAEQAAGTPSVHEPSFDRRRLLVAGIGAAAGSTGGLALAAVAKANGPRPNGPAAPPVRPPGSVPEEMFLQMCVRCGECLQACPNDVLQPLGMKQGLLWLWTPHVVADWSGCEASCNNCGWVCPTGAIRALPLAEKRAARMGRAIVDRQTCLPYAGRDACQVCVDECAAAGYHAIEFLQVGTAVDQLGNPIEDTGFRAPVVLAERCVGCGLCQTRCVAVNVKQKRLLKQTAILVVAGPGNEDRMARGSYVALREQEQRDRQRKQQRLIKDSGGSDSYLPENLR